MADQSKTLLGAEWADYRRRVLPLRAPAADEKLMISLQAELEQFCADVKAGKA